MIKPSRKYAELLYTSAWPGVKSRGLSPNNATRVSFGFVSLIRSPNSGSSV